MNATDTATAAPFVPAGVGIDGLRAAAAGCRGCELWEPATQTVFSKGAATARVVLVGEQPGDQEDKQGAPFVGPAGQLLNKALAEAGVDPGISYVTNAVKHFRFTRTGQRRLHQTPEARHIEACKPWLVAELSVLDPEIVVALGATAGRALVGPSFRVTKQRGQLIPWPDATVGRGAAAYEAGIGRRCAWLVPTVHPSSVLRADDRDAAYAALVADLRVVAEALA
jgi:uracil-DNA glycosylase